MIGSNGVESITDEDRYYHGSRFSDVQKAVFSNPYYEFWGSKGGTMPVYNVTLGRLVRGMIPFVRPSSFKKAAERAVDSSADLRWGPDRKGFRRLLHPNGICLSGLWKITEATKYSGYFRKESEALIIGRYSTCCRETRRGHARSLSLVGKLFPTTDPNHSDPLRTANFITQQDIGGDYTNYINDVELRNAPDTTIWRRGFGMSVLIVTGMVFARIDKKPSIRQLYEIAELGKPKNERTRAPTFMRLLVDVNQPRIDSEHLDFRDEIMAHIYDRGVLAPQRTLTFNIEVTDEGETRGPPVLERRVFRNWHPIGTITFDQAVASYNGDFVIHFHHPTWRDDQNDSATATRVDERKVRS